MELLNGYREKLKNAISDCEKSLRDADNLFKTYESLKEFILTTHQSLKINAMIPISNVCFMPGSLTKTNEVTILLGDNYFAKVSTFDAQKIIDHRFEILQKQISELTKQKENYALKLDNFNQLFPSDYVEIHEPYDEEQDKEWRLKHKQNIKNAIVEQKNVKSHNVSKANKQVKWNIDEIETTMDIIDTLLNVESLSLNQSDSVEFEITKKPEPSKSILKKTNISQLDPNSTIIPKAKKPEIAKIENVIGDIKLNAATNTQNTIPPKMSKFKREREEKRNRKI